MTTYADMLYQLGGVPVGTGGVPYGRTSKVFFMDPNDSAGAFNTNDGLTLDHPVLDLATAYGKTTNSKNDQIRFLATGSSATNPSTAIAWSNSYTHLIGECTPIGIAQRCRVVGTAGNDLTQVVTFSGSGCIVANIQFYNGTDADADSGAVIVSGSRNYFYNCHFAGMGHATPGARAGSWSLKVTGDENLFEYCTIGLTTVLRAAANPELWINGTAARNVFRHCRIVSNSATATKLAVLIDGMADFVEFDDCLFFNNSTNYAQAPNNGISDTVATTHYIILRPNCQFVGITGIADTVTRIYGSGAAPNAGMFLSTQPTT